VVLSAACRRGRRGVITFGGIGTHHGLATTICAHDAGLRTLLVLLPQPVTERPPLPASTWRTAPSWPRPSIAAAAATALRLCTAHW
jgi:hypothetical protein